MVFEAAYFEVITWSLQFSPVTVYTVKLTCRTALMLVNIRYEHEPLWKPGVSETKMSFMHRPLQETNEI